jgi:hypothetical protein
MTYITFLAYFLNQESHHGQLVFEFHFTLYKAKFTLEKVTKAQQMHNSTLSLT